MGPGTDEAEVRADADRGGETGLGQAPQPRGLCNSDGMFEGGGKLGTAFLGAVRCRSEVGIRWKELAETSAGAITATLLVSNLEIDRLEQICCLSGDPRIRPRRICSICLRPMNQRRSAVKFRILVGFLLYAAKRLE